MRKIIYTLIVMATVMMLLASCSTTDSYTYTPTADLEFEAPEVPDYKFAEEAEPPIPSKDNIPAVFIPSGDLMPGGESMMATRSLMVLQPSDLESGIYNVIGTVEGKGRINADNPEDGDSHMYGRLTEEEVDSVDYVSIEGTDPYAVSLSNAIADMIQNAWAEDAAFVVFPSYVVKFTEDRYIETTVRAVAVGINPTPAN